jgi:hypothetical protein
MGCPGRILRITRLTPNHAFVVGREVLAIIKHQLCHQSQAPLLGYRAAGLQQVGVCANDVGTSHMRAAYHTAQATTNSDITHPDGID